jgi:hypothetical protein
MGGGEIRVSAPGWNLFAGIVTCCGARNLCRGGLMRRYRSDARVPEESFIDRQPIVALRVV